jgi:hypothetical protein
LTEVDNRSPLGWNAYGFEHPTCTEPSPGGEREAGSSAARLWRVPSTSFTLDLPGADLSSGDGVCGKTAPGLVSDLAKRAEELGFSVAVGHCLDLGRGGSLASQANLKSRRQR